MKGLSAKGMQKDLVFKRGGKEKAVHLQQDLRTDVSYLFHIIKLITKTLALKRFLSTYWIFLSKVSGRYIFV
ncbi:hypothetical protein F6Y05_41175 [Bacillus megaterium]|nr:hypothetical protein [Priestia megaterium]